MHGEHNVKLIAGMFRAIIRTVFNVTIYAHFNLAFNDSSLIACKLLLSSLLQIMIYTAL